MSRAGDPLRGHSIALFTRIYGDKQAPRRRLTIDAPRHHSEIYQDANPTLAEFELDHWKNFWRLSSDRGYAASQHVRVANGQGIWGMFEPGQRYTLTLEADGGLNMTTEPLPASAARR